MATDTPTTTVPDIDADSVDEAPAGSRILVAVSTARASQRMVDTVADLAARLGAEVLVVNVRKPGGASQRTPDETADGNEAINTLGEQIRRRGARVQTLLMFSDDVARAILSTAEEQGATLILLGLTGKGIVQRFFEGNVPLELIRETQIPVMLLPPNFDGVI